MHISFSWTHSLLFIKSLLFRYRLPWCTNASASWKKTHMHMPNTQYNKVYINKINRDLVTKCMHSCTQYQVASNIYSVSVGGLDIFHSRLHSKCIDNLSEKYLPWEKYWFSCFAYTEHLKFVSPALHASCQVVFGDQEMLMYKFSNSNLIWSTKASWKVAILISTSKLASECRKYLIDKLVVKIDKLVVKHESSKITADYLWTQSVVQSRIQINK